MKPGSDSLFVQFRKPFSRCVRKQRRFVTKKWQLSQESEKVRNLAPSVRRKNRKTNLSDLFFDISRRVPWVTIAAFPWGSTKTYRCVGGVSSSTRRPTRSPESGRDKKSGKRSVPSEEKLLAACSGQSNLAHRRPRALYRPRPTAKNQIYDCEKRFALNYEEIMANETHNSILII